MISEKDKLLLQSHLFDTIEVHTDTASALFIFDFLETKFREKGHKIKEVFNPQFVAELKEKGSLDLATIIQILTAFG